MHFIVTNLNNSIISRAVKAKVIIKHFGISYTIWTVLRFMRKMWKRLNLFMQNYLLFWQHCNSQYFAKVIPHFWVNRIETFLFFFHGIVLSALLEA